MAAVLKCDHALSSQKSGSFFPKNSSLRGLKGNRSVLRQSVGFRSASKERVSPKPADPEGQLIENVQRAFSQVTQTLETRAHQMETFPNTNQEARLSVFVFLKVAQVGKVFLSMTCPADICAIEVTNNLNLVSL